MTLYERISDWWSAFCGYEEIEYHGWVRATSEAIKETLRSYGLRGEMRWTQETPAFGTIGYCVADLTSLESLFVAVEQGLNIQIGGFTGVWKDTTTQVPHHRQFFYSKRWPTHSDFAERNGYCWDGQRGIYIEDLKGEGECPLFA